MVGIQKQKMSPIATDENLPNWRKYLKQKSSKREPKGESKNLSPLGGKVKKKQKEQKAP